MQHEFGIVDSRQLRAFCENRRCPVILVAHTGGVSQFSAYVDGFISLNPQVLNDVDRPLWHKPLPSFLAPERPTRTDLRLELGLPPDRVIIGSSGFMLGHREVPAILEKILPEAMRNNWLIYLALPRHSGTNERLWRAIGDIGQRYPDWLTHVSDFLPPLELSRRLKACDLLWCYTSLSDEVAYSIGVIADQYGSGTRIVSVSRNAHLPYTTYPNVVVAPNAADAFCANLLAEARSPCFPRHDPSACGWDTFAQSAAAFLERFT